MSYAKLLNAMKSGPGKGNWGHAGRPGLVGGSQPQTSYKGGSGSGNFGHSGRPGKIGGSAVVAFNPVILPHNRAIHEYATKNFENPDLSYEELQAARLYTYGGNPDRNINGYLRGKTDTVEQPILNAETGNFDKMLLSKAETENAIKHLDSAILKNKTKDDLYVYRVLFESVAKPGEVSENRGYTSTSLSPSSALDTYLKMEKQVDAPVLLRMRLPKGSNFLYAEKVGGMAGKTEMILPRGLKTKSSDLKNAKIDDFVGSSAAEDLFDDVKNVKFYDVDIVQ